MAQQNSLANYPGRISEEAGLPVSKVAATVGLLEAGNTIPFIARYRKEMTGSLDEVEIRQVSETWEKLRALDERRETILNSIETQGFLTPELKTQLLAARTRTELEDLYAPYKPKQRTRATIAIEKGLAGLADLIEAQSSSAGDPAELAAPYLNEKVPDVEEAYAGARDIVAARISENASVRSVLRARGLKFGMLRSEKIDGADDPRGVYQDYYEFEYRVETLRPHQVLALNRGEAEKVLRVKVIIPERDWLGSITEVFRPNPRCSLKGQLELAIMDSAGRLLLPSIENDLRRQLTEKAEIHAIQVFAQNVRALLSQPPLQGYTAIGIDPGFRTGCKVAVVDPTGKVLDTMTIYPHPPQSKYKESQKILEALVIKHNANLIAIGNGTASRETEQLTGELTRSRAGVQYLIVNEAGASVYSASDLARKELPGMDVSMRGAVSIARRALDPLAELVKIDPKSIGVGMYQHDVNQRELGRSLDGVVESVVNQVGVDANTASPALLTYVAGIGPKLAEKIVEHRDTNGPFTKRGGLLKVSGLGPKAYEQAAGFLRIRDGENLLDASAIHPESYKAAEKVIQLAGISYSAPSAEREAALQRIVSQKTISKLAEELGTGVPTLMDIIEQLIRPGRDPRADLPAPFLRSDTLSMKDLVSGMKLKGTVRNVVDFGAFVDIGVKQDGLLHRSQLPPGTVLHVGDIIDVIILRVEIERGRIGLGWPGKS